MQKSPLYQRANHDSSERPPPKRERPFSSNMRSAPGEQDRTFLFSWPACLANWRGAARAGHESRGARRKRKQGSPALRCLRIEQPQARPTGFSRITKHETRITAFFRPETRPFPWLVWYLLVLKPFSLVFSAGMCSGLRVMTPLLGTKTSSAPVGDAPAGDDKTAQATSFQVFTRPETRDTALVLREAQAGANSEVFTKHETRDTKHGFFQARNTAFPWLAWYLLVLKPFSLFFGRKPVYVESDDAVVGNENPVRARRGQVGRGQKSRPVAAFLRVVARHGAAMARHGRHGAPRATVRAPSLPAT